MNEYTSMTFAEIAAKLGIKHESARKLVKKHRWHRKPTNSGGVLIDVPNDYDWSRPNRVEPPEEVVVLDAPMPDEASPPETPTPPIQLIGERPDVVELRLAMARLETQVEGLNNLVIAERLRAAAEERRADDANGRVLKLENERDEWRDRYIDARRPWWKRKAG